MAHKLAILFTTLLVVIAAHNSLYSTKTHVMAQEDVLLSMAIQLFRGDICGKPCNTMEDCVGGVVCEACWTSKKSCGPLVGDAIEMGI